jgi:hypothetical protein
MAFFAPAPAPDPASVPAPDAFFSDASAFVGGAGEYEDEAAAFGVEVPEFAWEAISVAEGAWAASRAGRKALNFFSRTSGRALRT